MFVLSTGYSGIEKVLTEAVSVSRVAGRTSPCSMVIMTPLYAGALHFSLSLVYAHGYKPYRLYGIRL